MSLCHEVLEEALGRKVSPAESDRLFKKINRRAALLRAANPALPFNDSLAMVEREFAEAAELRVVLAKRNAALNQARTMESLDYLGTTWKDDPGQGLKAILVGTQDKRQGARASIGSDQQAAEDWYLGGLLADLAKVEGGLDTYVSGAEDTAVAHALFALSRGDDVSKMPPMAVGVAKVIRKWQDYARQKANDAGAWIGQAKGYITSTFHDRARIAAAPDGWLRTANDTFDLPRMAEEMEVDIKEMPEILEGIWQGLATGVHLKPEGTDVAPRKGLQSVGKKLSHDRVIHFKDADGWARYNQDFGAGNLHEAVVAGLRRQAKSTALMNTLGPNYEMNYDRIVLRTRERMRRENASAADILRFENDARRAKRLYLAELDGSLDIPASDTFATASQSVRSIQSMASLGGATLSSVSDLAVMALGAKYNGLNALQVIGKGIANLFDRPLDRALDAAGLGRTVVPEAEKLELYADLGVVFSSLAGKMTANRFVPDDGVPGRLGRLQSKFFTLNMQNRWTDSMREAVAELLSANLARQRGKSFDQLGAVGDTLKLYGIDADKWDIFRQVDAPEIDGTPFLSPKAMDDLPDAVFAKYLADRDQDATGYRIRTLRDEIQRQFRGYFSDQNAYMVLMPDAGTRGIMKMGTQKGTGLGEAVRFVMQFKAFPLAYTQRVIGRELRQGGVAGIAQMIALTSLFGYAAATFKDLSKGRQPRDPTDWRTWVAAFQQGGGAGLYGDVLFSQVIDRRFGDAASQLLGPTFSDVFGSQGVAGLVARATQGQDAGPAAVRFVQGNTPFLNLFYTRLALDYLAFYRLQEWMNPGSLSRMESEMEKRTGQQFIAPPSEVVQ